MNEQLLKLVLVAEQPMITIRVVPLAFGRTCGARRLVHIVPVPNSLFRSPYLARVHRQPAPLVRAANGTFATLIVL
jgi:hypothetical protein